MDLQEMLKQQQDKKSKSKLDIGSLRATTVEDYLSDSSQKRPYADGIESISKKRHKDSVVTHNANPTNITGLTSLDQMSVDIDIQETALPQSTRDAKHNVKATQSAPISDTKHKEKASQKFSTSDTTKSTKASQMATHKIHDVNDTTISYKRNSPKKRGVKPEKNHNYNTIQGNELNLLNKIYMECVKEKSLETDFIPKQSLAMDSGVKLGSIRTSCNRLKDKGIIDDFIATSGRNSMWKFFLSEVIYNQISNEKHLTTKTPPTISVTNSDTNILSSSSVVVNDTTTKISLPSEWKKINYAKLKNILYEKYNESFGFRQINSIFKNSADKLNADEVQESIDSFVTALLEDPNNNMFNRRVKVAVLLDTLYEGEIFKWKSQRLSLNDFEQKKYMEAKRKIHFETKLNEYKSKLTEDQILATVPDVFKRTNHLWGFAESSNDTAMLLNLAEEHVAQHFRRDHYEEIEEHED